MDEFAKVVGYIVIFAIGSGVILVAMTVALFVFDGWRAKRAARRR